MESQVESILVANWFLIKCKFEGKKSLTDVARKYLTKKIEKTLTQRKISKISKISTIEL